MRLDTAYTYHLRTENGTRFLCIVDGNQGMSLTNNIEHVVKQITEEERIDPAEVVIIYQDSDGMWDGWSHKQQQFFPLQAISESRAIQIYFLMYHN